MDATALGRDAGYRRVDARSPAVGGACHDVDFIAHGPLANHLLEKLLRGQKDHVNSK